MTTFLSNRSIYTSVICGIVPQVRERLWIATADIKDMYVDAGGRDMVPFLEVLARMVKRGIEVRLIHAKEPGPSLINPLVEQFDAVWRGAHCRDCGRREHCGDPVV